MSGGPSQFETFDPKKGQLLPPIDTAVKGVQFCNTLPQLAKMADDLAIIRTMTHREGDHGRATYLMRTGYEVGGQNDHPTLGSVLAKELGGDRPELPGYVNIAPFMFPGNVGHGPGFLGARYGPLIVANRLALRGETVEALRLPPVEFFEALDKKKGPAMRKAVENAFDLGMEKPAVRDTYGRNSFGQGCLLGAG